MTKSKGSSAVEFSLILPIAMLLIVASVALSLAGVRGIVAALASGRAARVASVFQDAFIGAELFAALPPELFRGGLFRIEGERLISNELPGALSVGAVGNGLFDSADLNMAAFRREAPVVPALPRGLTDAELRGGDTPSPYCRTEGGYAVCGYPE